MYSDAHLMRARDGEKEILCASEMTVERNGADASQKMLDNNNALGKILFDSAEAAAKRRKQTPIQNDAHQYIHTR